MLRSLYTLFALLVIAFGAVGVARLSFNVDLLKLLPRDLPGVAGTAAFQKFHDRPDELLITLHSSDGSEVADLAEELAAQLTAAPGLAQRVQAEPAWRTAPAARSSIRIGRSPRASISRSACARPGAESCPSISAPPGSMAL